MTTRETTAKEQPSPLAPSEHDDEAQLEQIPSNNWNQDNIESRGNPSMTLAAVDDDRPMEHYPPRPTVYDDDESHREPVSPPVAHGGSGETSLGIFSNPLEESVAKFFFPRPNSARHLMSSSSPSSHHHHRRHQSTSCGGGGVLPEALSPKTRVHLEMSALDHAATSSVPNDSTTTVGAAAEDNHQNDPGHHQSSHQADGPPETPLSSHAQQKLPEPPTIISGESSTTPQRQSIINNDTAAASMLHLPQIQQQPNTNVESTTVVSNNNSPGRPPPPPPSSTPSVSSSFQQPFDAEEEEDRKYVEQFWTIYDDIIMLSMFTQLGVVARLAVSTAFTYFDGIFRADSPLFTVLPLNCLSCFVLGLLGSGDRLMEVVTTRFTPQQLQQQIISRRGDDDDHDDEDDHDDTDEEDDHEHVFNNDNQRNGLRRRKRKIRRRPKRQKQQEDVFRGGGWQPPIHWHDDLREVQLLALERRIRASKCLILFPVKKEDADVMEHYFGEGYKASSTTQRQEEPQRRNSIRDHHHSSGAHQLRRRLRGRNKYVATELADMDHNDSFQQGKARQYYAQDNSDCEQQMQDGDLDDDSDEPVDDGLFRFDLKLTESVEETEKVDGGKTPQKQKPGSSTTSSLPFSVEKLIKRSPGLSSPERHLQSPAMASSNTTAHPPEQPVASPNQSSGNASNLQAETSGVSDHGSVATGSGASFATATGGEPVQHDPQLDQIISNVQANVSENISRIRRVNIADGWDVGTTPEAMSDDIILGLNFGFCGALSSFSSWNSSMLDLLRGGHIGEAFIGYLLGLQLPIVAYRFGQQAAVYYFVWKCRRETRRDEQRGYGIRVNMNGDDDEDDFAQRELHAITSSGPVANDHFADEHSRVSAADSVEEEDVLEQEVPSLRAICTALYLLALVTQFTSLSFFSEAEDQQIALSLLFSPFGSLARWRLAKLNTWRPGFPIGTLACNLLACAFSGSLGSLLAGNPGPRERTVLQSIIAGFGGTLSSVASFVQEVLAGIDPLLLRFDGIIYASLSIFWALVVGFIFSASVDWADETTQSVIVEDDFDPTLYNNTNNSTV